MKKFYFYAMVVVCLLCTATIHAQQRFWVGTTGNWNNTANWSTSSGGGSGASVPNGAGMSAIIDRDATITFDLGTVTLGRLVVQGPGTEVQLTAGVASTITVNGATDGNEGLLVGADAILRQTVSANVAFAITFANDALGQVDGTWHLVGIPAVTGSNGPTFNFPVADNESNRLDINNNGILRFGEGSRRAQPSASAGTNYLHFNNGSTYHIDRNGGGTIPATWAANSTILLTGIVDAPPSINTGTASLFGNLVVNCPAMNNPNNEVILLGLTNTMLFQGNIDVQNTNGFPLVLTTGVANPTVVGVAGNLSVSGNSVVYLADDALRSFIYTIGGNLNITSGSFRLQRSNDIATTLTVITLNGNLVHTGTGTFGPGSANASATTELFVLELNGVAGQFITSSGIQDDPTGMLTLRMNNAAGATLLSPSSFGKVSWNSASKGIITTDAANYLRITNPDPSITSNVINAPANNGYVSGPVRRVTNSTSAYRFPTGKGGVYDYNEVVPATTAVSEYTSEYFNTAHPNVGNVTSPLVAVSNTEYWNVSRQSGSAAAVQLHFTSPIPGAGAADGIVVAQYTSSWVRTPGGPALTPGDVTSGTVATSSLAAFNNAFTLAYGPASSLPIDLVSFTAKKLSGSAALLNWEVTASSTPDRFEVMRSTDGSGFTTIGTVQAVDQQTKYSYTDGSMPAGTVYYRLRLVDINGEVKLSKVVVLTNGTDGLFLTTMAPTIVTDRARVSVTSSQRGNLQLVITDMYGRIVKQQINGIDAGSQEIWLNLHSLSGGAYQITGYLDGKRSGSIRFIKQ